MNLIIENQKSVELTSDFDEKLKIVTLPSEKPETTKFVTEWEYAE